MFIANYGNMIWKKTQMLGVIWSARIKFQLHILVLSCFNLVLTKLLGRGRYRGWCSSKNLLPDSTFYNPTPLFNQRLTLKSQEHTLKTNVWTEFNQISTKCMSMMLMMIMSVIMMMLLHVVFFTMIMVAWVRFSYSQVPPRLRWQFPNTYWLRWF